MKQELLYETISNALKEQINSGKLLSGEKAPSIVMLREKFKVSAVTAVHALKKLHSSGYLEKKAGRGYFVADRMNYPGLKNLCVGCLLRANYISDTDHFFNDIISGIQHAAMMRKVNLLWSYLAMNICIRQPNIELELLQSAREMNHIVSGFLIDERIPDTVISEIIRLTNKPVVIVNRATSLKAYTVSSDYRLSMIKLIDILQKMEYKNFIFFATGANVFSSNEKLAAFRAAAKKFSWSEDQYKILPDTCLVSEGETYQNFHNAWKSMTIGKTAAITDSDTSARFLYRELQKDGISVPNDIGIAATEGLTLCRTHTPEITSFKVDTEKIGSTALNMLIDIISGHMIEPIQDKQIQSIFKIGETI